MRKISLILLVTAFAANAAAQSGRRIATPPPTPVEPPVQEQSAPETESAPDNRMAALAELTTLPESVRKRQLKSLDKGSFSLADFGGKIIVVNLWASWCGPCRREVPEYEEVRKAYMSRGVEFIGLTVEDPRTAAARVKQFVHDFNFGFRLAWADRDTAITLSNGRGVIPQTLVIAADGRILNHWRGYSSGHSGDRLRQALDRALSGETQRSAP